MKYFEETLGVYFGGARKQITLHTVVVYTRENDELKVECFCTMSESLLHNAFAIWAHLKPILNNVSTKRTVSTLHFISDSPSTQYRNKTMFHFLATNLKIYYPLLHKFTWNYSEEGHWKDAPDGIGGTCKRTADRIVAQGEDLVDFGILFEKLKINCHGIHLFLFNKQK